MTENQAKIIRTLKWIVYPIAILMLIGFVLKFIGFDLFKNKDGIYSILSMIEKGFWFILIGIMCFVVLALIQNYFSKKKLTSPGQDASRAQLLLRIDTNRETFGNLVFTIIALGFCVMLNILLFSPDSIIGEDQLQQIDLFGKLLYGLFYVIAHFLFVVFTMRLIKGNPPLFVATEAGFCYEPAGINSGWILWEEVADVKETTILYGSSVTNGPKSIPVLGLKLKNPNHQSTDAYSPLLRILANNARKFNNFQTEGAGDILINPDDFGAEYEKVKSLIISRVNNRS